MSLTIERPPTAGAPPELPPYLRKRRGGPERRVVILPDMRLIMHQSVVGSAVDDWQTVIYQWMVRITGAENIFSPEATWEGAHISTRRYRRWLETYETPDGIPPHIQFAGRMPHTPPPAPPDPTLFERWKAYAQETFV